MISIFLQQVFMEILEFEMDPLVYVSPASRLEILLVLTNFPNWKRMPLSRNVNMETFWCMHNLGVPCVYIRTPRSRFLIRISLRKFEKLKSFKGITNGSRWSWLMEKPKVKISWDFSFKECCTRKIEFLRREFFGIYIFHLISLFVAQLSNPAQN